MLNIIRPLSLGTEGRAEALCGTTKTKERRRAGETEGKRSSEQFLFGSPGSKAHLRVKERKGSLIGTGRLKREPGFPAEPGARQNSGQRLASGTQSSPAPPGLESPATGVLSSPGLRPPNPGKSFYDPCLNVPGGGAALLPLAGSGKRVSGSGNPVLVD